MFNNVCENKKILGIDYGDFNIGLAIFDVQNNFIYPYKTIIREKANILRKSIREIIEIIEKENIDKLVVGLPLNMDGSIGMRVEKVKIFVQMLKNKLLIIKNKVKYEDIIKIHFQDERLTTREATEILFDRGVKRNEHKKVIDQLAAIIILQDYREMLMKNSKLSF